MKTKILFFSIALLLSIWSCKNNEAKEPTTDTNNNPSVVGQSGVQDDISNPNIVQVASKSEDHTTLVKAVQAAGLVDALSNAGPFTVFAPTNAAFDALPPNTVSDLLKPENKDKLVDILGYHTYVGVLKTEYLQDGQEFEMVTPQKVKITKEGEKILVNGAEIVSSISTSNGVIHVIGNVLLPK